MVGLRDRFKPHRSLLWILLFCVTVSLSVPIRLEEKKSCFGYIEKILQPIIVWPTVIGVVLLCSIVYSVYYEPFTLPQVLRDVEHFDVRYMQSTKQTKKGCAWYAVLNARAIQELVHDNKAVTSRSIARVVCRKLIPFIKNNKKHVLKSVGVSSLWDGLTICEMGGLVHALGPEVVYNMRLPSIGGLPCLNYTGTLSDPSSLGLAESGESLYSIFDLSRFLSVVMCNDVPVKQFLLGMPSSLNACHEVLISIIQRPDKKPLLIYMDSNNTPFSICHLDYVVPFFVCEFIKELDTAAGCVAQPS